MKLTGASCLLLTAGLCRVAAIELATTETLHAASKHSDGDGIATIDKNFNGWVNPEDLTPMPQCIAQQDQSAWLSTMTKCTRKRCTSHFGIICTHHQWLTELSCLSTEFSPDVVRDYVPYCGRSVLAKAQLYYWIRYTTGRTWLADVGDANGLQTLSPASLARGYAAVDVTYNAPTCLTDSLSAAPWMEPFQHVMASCGFTSTTQHTGNAARPWEYSESRRSMIALDFETASYNLTGGSIRYGDYFDKECFCSVFTTPLNEEPCSALGQIDLTRERLWINATCGPTSLPDNWTDMLKTMGFAYIPIKDWHWPACVADMPKQVTGLIDECATDACEIDSSGFCQIRRAIDRTCFCRSISYDSCGGLCHIFETRIDYVEWLYHLCGNVQDWHGLPDDWRRLAAPFPVDMIPWRWTLKPSNGSNVASITRLASIKAMGKCPSNDSKLRSFALVNIATFLAAFFIQGIVIHRITQDSLWHLSWYSKGILIATLEVLANCFNVFLIQKAAGYEDVPVVQLMLLWCSIPRLGWLTIWPISAQPFKAINPSAVASSLFAEVIHQFLSSYYMLLTISYGLEHNFYFRNLEDAERGQSAKTMYAGALLWLIIIAMAFASLMRTFQRISRLTRSSGADLSKWQMVHYWIERSRALGEIASTDRERGHYTVYGTLTVERKSDQIAQKAFAKLYKVTAVGVPLLWVAHWLFWGGFIGLSSEEFCPPNLGVFTAVGITFSVASIAIRIAL